MQICAMPECQTTAGCHCGRRHTTAIPQDPSTQAQAARIIFERIASGENVSAEQRLGLIEFLSR